MENNRNKQAGMTLVELMVALGIGVTISFGTVSLFLHSKTSYLQDEETARLQENGRWALRYVARELSMGGFNGGLVEGGAVTTALTVASDCGTDWVVDTGVSIEHLNNVTDSSATTAYDCMATGDVLPGTDIVAVRRTKDTPHVFDGSVSAALVDNTVYLRVEEYGAAATLVKGSSITTADTTAGSKVDVWQYQPQFLFIRDYSEVDGDNIPSLCRKLMTTAASTLAMDSTECLVEGIENLQVEFGMDDSTPMDYVPDYYTAAPTAAELQTAVAARIYLLTRSINEVSGYTNDKTYALGASTVAAANDGHYRRVLQTTVMLRNSEAFGF
jgi:prepilin-type N-terminal cleavage/methylation domain-containing protein